MLPIVHTPGYRVAGVYQQATLVLIDTIYMYLTTRWPNRWTHTIGLLPASYYIIHTSFDSRPHGTSVYSRLLRALTVRSSIAAVFRLSPAVGILRWGCWSGER